MHLVLDPVQFGQMPLCLRFIALVILNEMSPMSGATRRDYLQRVEAVSLGMAPQALVEASFTDGRTPWILSVAPTALSRLASGPYLRTLFRSRRPDALIQAEGGR